MDKKHEHLLANYQYLMDSHEKMLARWLTEEWDRETEAIPRWLLQKISLKYPHKKLDKPVSLARDICLNLLQNHKHEITLPKK